LQVIGLALSAAGACALLVFAHLPQREATVVVLDVGQGDSTLIQTPAGRTILIDGGGTRDNRFDIGKRVVAPTLWNRGIRRIDLAVLSHPHPDHMNGLISTLDLIPADTILWSGRDSGLPGRERLEEVARSQGSRLRAIDASDRPFAVGDAVVRVLHPAPDYRIGTRMAYADENNRSLVVVVEADGLRLLAAGDIHKEAERAVLKSGQSLKCYILKAPHHGSKTSNTQPFVTAAAPAVAVISVGRGNPYGQPAAAVLDRYEQSGARMFRTDRDGAVIIRKTAAGLAVTCWDACLLRAATASPAAWIGQERENWKRLLLRRAAT
jgi:competence protein ComEC